MSNTMTILIPDIPAVQVTVAKVLNADTGLTELRFDLTLDEASAEGDLRGLFFDATDESLLAGLSVSGDDVTGSAFAGDLDPDRVGLMRFGARLTSVGPEGDRRSSRKLVGTAPEPPAPPMRSTIGPIPTARSIPAASS